MAHFSLEKNKMKQIFLIAMLLLSPDFLFASYPTLPAPIQQVKKGWSIADALSIPLRPRKKEQA